MSAGGRKALGYDHLSPLINSNCAACHEAGSDLVGTVWNGATAQNLGAGDTRPITLATVTPSYKGNTTNVTVPNHFFAIDCKECHLVPAGNGLTTTGATFTTAWRFDHATSCPKMTKPTTCKNCHTRSTSCN
jgi:hypothetical protein